MPTPSCLQSNAMSIIIAEWERVKAKYYMKFIPFFLVPLIYWRLLCRIIRPLLMCAFHRQSIHSFLYFFVLIFNQTFNEQSILTFAKILSDWTKVQCKHGIFPNWPKFEGSWDRANKHIIITTMYRTVSLCAHIGVEFWQNDSKKVPISDLVKFSGTHNHKFWHFHFGIQPMGYDWFECRFCVKFGYNFCFLSHTPFLACVFALQIESHYGWKVKFHLKFSMFCLKKNESSFV